MSYEFQIGDTTIPYAVRYSDRAKLKRMVVTADAVQVVASFNPPMDGLARAFAFLDTRRRWLFQAAQNVGRRAEHRRKERYASGAKIQFRRRSLMLDVTP